MRLKKKKVSKRKRKRSDEAVKSLTRGGGGGGGTAAGAGGPEKERRVEIDLLFAYTRVSLVFLHLVSICRNDKLWESSIEKERTWMATGDCCCLP